MVVRIEFYGIARQRSGTAFCDLETGERPVRLSEVFQRLERLFPRLAVDCLQSGRLAAGYTANLDGRQFVTDPATPVSPGQSLLILSADAGG